MGSDVDSKIRSWATGYYGATIKYEDVPTLINCVRAFVAEATMAERKMLRFANDPHNTIDGIGERETFTRAQLDAAVRDAVAACLRDLYSAPMHLPLTEYLAVVEQRIRARAGQQEKGNG